MTELKPRIVELKRFVDDRGVLDQLYDSDLDFKIKRLYLVAPFKGIKRGLHGHFKEWKAFCVLSGSAKFVVAELEPEEDPAKPISFTLNSKKPSILVVPPGYLNGFVAVEYNTKILGLSSSTLEESKLDDFRQPWNKFGEDIWETENR